jgi:hypothetical protein
MNIKDINNLAKTAGDEAERKRQARVAAIRKDAAKRRAEAQTANEQLRIKEAEKLKGEVWGAFRLNNRAFSESDFNAMWKDPAIRLRLIREHNNASGFSRM